MEQKKLGRIKARVALSWGPRERKVQESKHPRVNCLRKELAKGVLCSYPGEEILREELSGEECVGEQFSCTLFKMLFRYYTDAR